MPSTWNENGRARSYYLGASARFSVVATNSAGSATDPDAVNFSFTDPSGNEVTYVYGTDAELVKDSTGNYHVDVDLDEVGTWSVRWFSTGAGQGAVEGEILVRASAYD